MNFKILKFTMSWLDGEFEAKIVNRFDSIDGLKMYVGNIEHEGDEFYIFENENGYWATRYDGNSFAIRNFLDEVYAQENYECCYED